jgi:UDP-GlcNAc:undecaprenyl-phosphate GlcNAc-1-phosphate transferase
VVQGCAGLVAYWAGVRVLSVGGVGVGEVWWSLPLTVFWLVLCTNALNLIDGVDGLASGVGVFAALTAMAAGMMQGNYGLVMATAPLAGALLGFLRYNFNPASIFLGDSGSYVVGFLLGCYGLLWSQKAATLLGMTAPLIALAIPLMDVGLSVVRRYLRGQPLFGADRGHIHHRLLARGWTVRRVVLVLYGLSGLFAVLSLVGSAWQGRMSGMVLVVFAVAGWVGVQNLGYVELSMAGKMIRPRVFRRVLGAELSLKTMRDGLERARTGEEVWTVVKRGAKELGFQSAELHLDGLEYGERFGEAVEEWRMTVPLNGRGRLELGHGFEAGGVMALADPLAKMMREVVGGKQG